jgi:hypothetical protein
MGWPDHPIFGQGVAGHPIPAIWGWPKPPQAFGGGPAIPKGQKKKRRKNGFWPLGVAGPPPRAWGWLRTSPTGRRGWPKPPPGPRGGPATPKGQNPFFRCSFFFWPFGVASATPIRPVWGGRSHPLAKNGVVRPPHFLGKGWLQPPQFLPLFFFLPFFKKKKKKNPKICKTTPFCSKWRRFGRAQNGVVLEWRV